MQRELYDDDEPLPALFTRPLRYGWSEPIAGTPPVNLNRVQPKSFRNWTTGQDVLQHFPNPTSWPYGYRIWVDQSPVNTLDGPKGQPVTVIMRLDSQGGSDGTIVVAKDLSHLAPVVFDDMCYTRSCQTKRL